MGRSIVTHVIRIVSYILLSNVALGQNSKTLPPCIPESDELVAFGKHFLKQGELPLSPANINFDDNDGNQKAKRDESVILKHLAGPIKCANVSRTVEAPLTHRAVCPWKWTLNRNPKRIPKDLMEARCTCEGHAPHLAYECEPIRVVMKVLYFDTSCNGYRVSEEVIQVACVAVSPASHYTRDVMK